MGKTGILVFPGSNCDHDAYHAVTHVLGGDAAFIWHKETSLSGIDAVIIPGGFSFGDYLRSGAIARFSPIMKEVVSFAQKGGLVIGICNGFQILLEANLLPGTMLHNEQLSFVCRQSFIRCNSNTTPFTHHITPGSVLKIPVAHGEGNYFADDATLSALQDNQQIIFQYCDVDGKLVPEANPNGATHNIAGICSSKRNVLGMMPHPERAVEKELGSTDGRVILQSMLDSLVHANQAF